MKKTQKIQKGCYGYMLYQKKFTLLRTIVYFALSFALLAAGIIQTGSKQNLLTVVAVLGMLPASKSAVNTVMFFRYRGCSGQAYEQIAAHAGGMTVLYDIVMTTYSKTFCISGLVIRGHNICGYLETEKTDEAEAQKHIEDTLRTDGHKGYSVKLFRSLSKYTDRLEQLQLLAKEDEKETEKEESAAQTLLSVSL